MKLQSVLAVCACVSQLSACATLKTGDFVRQSHYVEAGSHIKPLGRVSAEVNQASFLVSPDFDLAKALELFDQALNQQKGATMLINYRIDEKTRTWFLPIPFLPWHTLDVVVQGTAAAVEKDK
ncbi:MAG: hypothetical protein ACKN9T_01450 [Candidatus Methylumidiphilus sp.]